MGDGYGPMLVATFPRRRLRTTNGNKRAWLRGKRIAIPGKMTSAYLGLRLFMEECEYAGRAV